MYIYSFYEQNTDDDEDISERSICFKLIRRGLIANKKQRVGNWRSRVD